LWQRWCDEKARESDDDEDERSDEDDDDNGQCGSVDDSKGDSNQDTAEQYEGDESAGEFSSKLIDTLEI
jgi:hypothetical protein